MDEESSSSVTLKWLGTAGFEIRSGGRTLLLDPFVTRTPFYKLIPWAKIYPDESAVEKHLPEADLILIGHSHYDHLLDAPLAATRTGAVLAGSPTTCFIAESLGVPREQMRAQSDPPEPFEEGPFKVRFIPSLHGKVIFGKVLLPGKIEAPLPPPPRRGKDFPAGGVYGLHIETGGLSFYHLGSADLIDREIEDLRADVLFICLYGISQTPNCLEWVIGSLKPKIVIPCHYDYFFRPLEKGLKCLPGIKMEAFRAETKRLAPQARIIEPDLLETVVIDPDNLFSD